MISEDNNKYLETIEKQCQNLGLNNISRKITNEEFNINEEDYIKFNLPDTIEKFGTGNGEGVWGVPYTKKDKEISDTDLDDTTFKVVLLNDSLFYPFPYGTILSVDCRAGFRPVLSEKWFDNLLQKEADTSLQEFLNQI